MYNLLELEQTIPVVAISVKHVMYVRHNTLQVDFYDEAGIAAYKNHVKDSAVEAPTPIHTVSVNHPVSQFLRVSFG